MSTELFESIEGHDSERLAHLLGQDADPNALRDTPPHWRPLHEAIEQLEHDGPIDALVILLRHGAQVDALDAKRDATPLLMACFRGQRDAIRILLAAGADPNVVGGEGDSPVRWWVQRGDREMVALLLDCGANATIDNAGGLNGMTALGAAASSLDLPMIELLLDHGADPEALDLDHRTARQRLPGREFSDAEVWDAAVRLVGGPQRPPVLPS